MPDSGLQITIGVDASGARDGADQAKAAVAGIGPQIEALGKTFGELGKSLKGAFEGIGQIGKAIAGVGKEGGGQLQSVAVSLKSVNEAAAGLGGAASGLQTLSHSATEMAVSLSGGKLSGVSASLKTLGEAVAGVGRSAPAGLKAVSTAASELSISLGSAAGQGASKLALLGEAAGGLAGVALAVGQVALTAATATAEWAEHTEHSATASAQAKANAASLNDAIKGAGDAFSKVGDTLANAFAPVLTTVVNALTGLANGFEESYNQGGAAKAIVDTLIAAFKLLASIVEIAIRAVVAAIEQVRSQIQQWRDEFGLTKTAVAGGVDTLKTEFQTLGRIFRDVLSGDFGRAATDFNSGLADMQRQARETVADIQQQLAKLGADKLAGQQAVARAFLGGAPKATDASGGSLSRRTGDRPIGYRHSSPASPSAKSSAPPAAPGSPCECDPAAAAACEQAAQQAKTEAANQGDQQRLQSSQATAEKLKAGQQGDDQEMVDEILRTVANEVEAHKEAAAKIAEAQRKAAEESKRAWDKSVGSIIQSFGDGLLKMAEGTESFGQLMRKVGQKIATDWVNNISKMVSETIRGWVQHVAAANTGNAAITASNQAAANTNLMITLETNLKKVLSDAKTAAAGAYNWAVAWGGPIAGAIAGATAFAGVMAFEMASAAGGYDIPAGVNPLAQLHAQEMVLPARLANPMRDMLANFGSGATSAPGGGHTFSFGDTHIHGAPNMSPADFRQALAEHRANVAGAVADALRSGWRPSYRQPVGAL